MVRLNQTDFLSTKLDVSMSKRVLSIGQCGPDHAALAGFIQSRFDAIVEAADHYPDAARKLAQGDYALVLVNRKLDVDYSDGVDVIQRLKTDSASAETPVMLVTNYADHQATAQAIGAELGFGKLELDDERAGKRLAPFLGE